MRVANAIGIVFHFPDSTATRCSDIAAKGGFMLDCDHGGGHCCSSAELKAAQWQFLLDHPFGVDPEPYAVQLSSSVPTFCELCM
jgi:hypothetical protein